MRRPALLFSPAAPWLAACLGLAVLAALTLALVRAPGWAPDMRLLLPIMRDWWLGRGALYPPPSPDSLAAGAAVYKWPPLFAVLVGPFVARSLDGTLWAFTFGALAFCVSALVAWVRDAGLASRSWAAAKVFWALAAFQPFYETAWGPTNELLIVGLLAMALVLIRNERPGAAALAFAAAIVLKVYPAFLALPFALRGHRRFLLFTGAWLLVLTLIGAAGGGAAETLLFHLRVLPLLGGSAVTSENAGLETLAAVAAAAAGMELGRLLPGTTAALMAVRGFLVLGLVLLTRHKTLGTAREPALLGAATAVMLLFMPASWLNYQILLVFPLLLGFAGPRAPRALPHFAPRLLASLAALIVSAPLNLALLSVLDSKPPTIGSALARVSPDVAWRHAQARRPRRTGAAAVGSGQPGSDISAPGIRSVRESPAPSGRSRMALLFVIALRPLATLLALGACVLRCLESGEPLPET